MSPLRGYGEGLPDLPCPRGGARHWHLVRSALIKAVLRSGSAREGKTILTPSRSSRRRIHTGHQESAVDSRSP